MLPRFRQLPVAALLLVVGVGLIYFGADLVARLELDFGELATLQRQLDEGRRSDEALEYRRQVVLARLAAKDQAVAELLAGRLTLLQAAARFRDVDESLPYTWGPCRPDRGGPAEGVRLCRVVMLWAQNWLEVYQPEKAAGVTASLEAILQQHRDQDGVVHLPD